jgi:hypothetical protein
MSNFYCKISAVSASTVQSSPHLFLRSEKKSVYWLDPPLSDSGSHHEAYGDTAYACQLHCGNDSRREPFFIGGFQLISNARRVDVFLTTDNGSHSGTFLTSVKGLSVVRNDTPKLFKAQCVIPGGPRRVRSVRLVFQSLQPLAVPPSPLLQDNKSAKLCVAEESASGPIRFCLDYVRWTLRDATENLPTALSDVSALATTISGPTATKPVIFDESNGNITNFMALMNTTSKPQENSDVMAAVVGLAMALKGTEDRLKQQLRHETSIVQAQITDLSKQIEALMAVIQGMELKQEQNTSLILSRQQRLEERLGVVHLELQKTKASTTPETEASTGEVLDAISL